MSVRFVFAELESTLSKGDQSLIFVGAGGVCVVMK